MKAIDRYVQARAEKERLEAELSSAKKELANAEKGVIEHLQESGVSNLKLDNGLHFIPQTNFQVSVTLGNQDQWKEFLVNRGETLDDYVREQVDKAALKKFAKEVYDDEGKLSFEAEGLPIFDDPRLTVRGWGEFSKEAR